MATDDPGVPAELHQRLLALGVTSVVAAPIVVAGEIWGALAVSVTRDLRFAANAEERLGQFAGLVAVAIANAQAREELATLADEQAALSRVAVAVATEERPERLFGLVSEEIGRLFGADAAATVRYVDDADEAEIVGGWLRDGDFDAPLGVRLPFQGGAIERVARDGPNSAHRPRAGAGRRPGAHGRRGRALGSGRSDRGFRAALGRYLDLDGRCRPSFHPASRSGSRSSRASWRSPSRTPRRASS